MGQSNADGVTYQGALQQRGKEEEHDNYVVVEEVVAVAVAAALVGDEGKYRKRALRTVSGGAGLRGRTSRGSIVLLMELIKRVSGRRQGEIEIALRYAW